MRVVNEMLKGLKKGSMTDKKNNSVLSDLVAVIEARTFSRWYFGFFLIFIYLMAMAAWVYHYRHHKNNTLAQAQNLIFTSSSNLNQLPHQFYIPLVSAQAEIPALTNMAPVSEAFAYIASIAHQIPQKMQIEFTQSNEVEDQYQQALSLIDKGSIEAAILHLRLLLTHFPEHREARVTLADLLLKHQRFAEAENILQNILQRFPGDAALSQLQAQALTGQGKLTEALSTLHSAKPDIHTDPEYFAFLAALHEQLGQYREAIELYRSVLQIDPDNSVWWMGLGISLDANGQSAEAVQAYAHAQTADDLQPTLKTYADARMEQLEV